MNLAPGMAVKVRAILLVALAASPAAALAEESYSTGCVAAKAFDVKLTSTEHGAQMRVDLKHSAPASTKGATKISKVLLRSPYKSEATALPTQETPGADGAYVATFDAEAIRSLPAGDVNVVVTTPDGERVCRIKKSAREKLVAAR